MISFEHLIQVCSYWAEKWDTGVGQKGDIVPTGRIDASFVYAKELGS